MSNSEIASIIAGIGNRAAASLNKKRTTGGSNFYDTEIAKINAQHALRAQAIHHILTDWQDERNAQRSNEAAQQAHEHTTLQSTQAHDQQMEKLRWVAANSVHGGDVHFETAAGDVMKFKANNPAVPTTTNAAPRTSRSTKPTRVMADGSHLPKQHRDKYVNGTRAEKIALNKKYGPKK